jgi:hypothetical protein
MVRKATRLPSGTRISDQVSLGVLTATMPAELVDTVLADTGRQGQRQQQLPARLVVYYVMALSLHAQASYGKVLRCLPEGIRWLRLGGAELAVATRLAITWSWLVPHRRSLGAGARQVDEPEHDGEV